MSILRRLRASDGFTLTELIVAMPIGMLVIIAALTLVPTAQRSERASRERSLALTRQQAGVERMSRELRHATSFSYINTQKIEFDTFVRTSGTGVLRRVLYDCSSGTACTRQEGPGGGTVTAAKKTLIDALDDNVDVFEAKPDALAPRYIGLRLKVRFAPDKPRIILYDGVELRNLSSRF